MNAKSVYNRFFSGSAGRLPLLAVLFMLVFPACSFFERRADDTLLARVYSSRLYLEDIADIIPQGSAPGDSIAAIQRYVDLWVNQQVFLYHANQNLPREHADFERKVENYKNTLFIHAYENLLAKQEMDTLVTEADILAYYEKYTPHFRLKDNIIRCTYVKLPLGIGDHNVVRSLYRSDRDEDLERLEDFALQNAAAYFMDEDRWLVFNDVLMDMPLDVEDPVNYLRNNRFVEISDDYYRYFLYIHEYRLRGDISPVEFEYENVRRLILSRRKQEFLREKRRELLYQAIEGKRVETYF